MGLHFPEAIIRVIGLENEGRISVVKENNHIACFSHKKIFQLLVILFFIVLYAGVNISGYV